MSKRQQGQEQNQDPNELQEAYRRRHEAIFHLFMISLIVILIAI